MHSPEKSCFFSNWTNRFVKKRWTSVSHQPTDRRRHGTCYYLSINWISFICIVSMCWNEQFVALANLVSEITWKSENISKLWEKNQELRLVCICGCGFIHTNNIGAFLVCRPQANQANLYCFTWIDAWTPSIQNSTMFYSYQNRFFDIKSYSRLFESILLQLMKPFELWKKWFFLASDFTKIIPSKNCNYHSPYHSVSRILKYMTILHFQYFGLFQTFYFIERCSDSFECKLVQLQPRHIGIERTHLAK